MNGKLPGDKYVGFVNLKCFDFVGKCDEESEGARDIISAIMFHIATTTTLLGEKIKPDWTELYKNKDFVFAISIFIKHLNILMTNQFTVNYYYLIIIFKIISKFCFIFGFVFYR